jgi:hypothetical protein
MSPPGGSAVSIVAVILVCCVGASGCGSGDKEGSNTASAGFAAQAEKRRLQIQELKAELKRERKRQSHAEAPEAGGRGGPPDRHSFASLERTLPGEVGIAIGPRRDGSAITAGPLQTGSAWSTSKVPLALRVLQEEGGPEELSGSQAEEIRRALTLSDNEAALALFADLERSHGGLAGAAAAVDEEVLREAGDSSTQIASVGRDGFTPFGQTDWSLSMQELFMSELAAGCIVSPSSSKYILELMGEVSSDTWGLGSAGLPARWKGGWGPGPDGRYLVRQMGTLSVGDKKAVVALAALPDDGQFATGQKMATSLAQWLARRAPRYAAVPAGC